MRRKGCSEWTLRPQGAAGVCGDRPEPQSRARTRRWKRARPHGHRRLGTLVTPPSGLPSCGRGQGRPPGAASGRKSGGHRQCHWLFCLRCAEAAAAVRGLGCPAQVSVSSRGLGRVQSARRCPLCRKQPGGRREPPCVRLRVRGRATCFLNVPLHLVTHITACRGSPSGRRSRGAGAHGGSRAKAKPTRPARGPRAATSHPVGGRCEPLRLSDRRAANVRPRGDTATAMSCPESVTAIPIPRVPGPSVL